MWAPETDVLTSSPGDFEASLRITTITTVPITLQPQELKEEQLSEPSLEIGGGEMGALKVVLDSDTGRGHICRWQSSMDAAEREVKVSETFMIFLRSLVSMRCIRGSFCLLTSLFTKQSQD